jgi:hypothetical protein
MFDRYIEDLKRAYPGAKITVLHDAIFVGEPSKGVEAEIEAYQRGLAGVYMANIRMKKEIHYMAMKHESSPFVSRNVKQDSTVGIYSKKTWKHEETPEEFRFLKHSEANNPQAGGLRPVVYLKKHFWAEDVGHSIFIRRREKSEFRQGWEAAIDHLTSPHDGKSARVYYTDPLLDMPTVAFFVEEEKKSVPAMRWYQ